MRFHVMPPAGVTLSPAPIAAAAQLALSPDGRTLAFVAAARQQPSQLWVHSLQPGQAQALPGADGATFPFWSPDSRSIGFFADGKLKRIEIAGGGPQFLAEATNGRGGSWNSAGDIVFTPAPSGAIYRVSARGGSVTQETALDEEQGMVTQYFPQFLPDGRRFLYYQRFRETDKNGIYVETLGAADPKRVLDSSGMGVYSDGSLLFVRDGILFAIAVDPGTLETRGEPVRFAESVGHFGGTFGFVAATASTTGIVAHGPSVVMSTRLEWRNQSGGLISAITTPGVYRSPDLAPDENSVAVSLSEENSDIYLIELTRGGGRSRVTAHPRNDWFPVWSPDGNRLFFSSTRVGSSTMYQKAPSAAGAGDQVVPTTYSGMYPTDVSPDGKHVIYHQIAPANGYDLAFVSLASTTTAMPFWTSRFNEVQARFSPNGKWVAYASDESGKFEIYVRPFPPAPAQWAITSGGGIQPQWRADGKELFFVAGDGTLMAADVTTDSLTFSARPPRPLFPVEIPEMIAPYPNDYAVTADGHRFLVNSIVEQPTKPALTVILNWAAELQRP